MATSQCVSMRHPGGRCSQFGNFDLREFIPEEWARLGVPGYPPGHAGTPGRTGVPRASPRGTLGCPRGIPRAPRGAPGPPPCELESKHNHLSSQHRFRVATPTHPEYTKGGMYGPHLVLFLEPQQEATVEGSCRGWQSKNPKECSGTIPRECGARHVWSRCRFDGIHAPRWKRKRIFTRNRSSCRCSNRTYSSKFQFR